MRRFLPLCAALLALALSLGAVDVVLPNRSNSLHLALIGDVGTGIQEEYDIAAVMQQCRQKFPFNSVLMLGDNIYGGKTPEDFAEKFEKPFEPLLSAGVKFYAVLGNHDIPAETSYKPFNMNGRRYYTLQLAPDVQFFAIDSTSLDLEQLQWLENELKASRSPWKVCFFHHPWYSSGRHSRLSPPKDKQAVLEPLFVKYGVRVVLNGHEHFYERITPQRGIYYFVSGGAGQLRKHDLKPREWTAKGYDRDYHFMLLEFAGNTLSFEAIDRKGRTIDSGQVPRTDR